MKRILTHSLRLLTARERRQLGLYTALNALTSLVDILSLALLVVMVQRYTNSAQYPLWNRLYAYSSGRSFLLPALAVGGLFVLKNTGAYFIYEAQTRFLYQLASRLSLSNLKQYLNGSFEDYTTTDAGVLTHRIQHQPIEYCIHVLAGLQSLFAEAVTSLLAVTGILIFNSKLTLLLTLTLLPPVVLVNWLARRKLSSAKGQLKHSAERTLQRLSEAIGSFVESNVDERTDFFSNRFHRNQRQMTSHLADLQIAQWMPGRLLEIFAIAGLLVLLMLGHYEHNPVGLVGLGAFMAAAYKVIPGVVRMTNLRVQIRHYAFTLENMEPAPERAQAVAAIPPRIERICFKKVGFSYKNLHVLRDFNATIEAGDFVQIIAPSGSGKTTLVHLLLGFLEPERGTISINGQPTGLEERIRYRRQIAYVKQQNFMLHDTIARNITLEETAVNELRLRDAIEAAGLDTLIAQQADGTAWVVADGGRNISGGQRQRIAIARALYKEASLVILDEPFSELDAASEQALLAHLQHLTRQGLTVILITHSPLSNGYCNKSISLHA